MHSYLPSPILVSLTGSICLRCLKGVDLTSGVLDDHDVPMHATDEELVAYYGLVTARPGPFVTYV